MKDLNDENYLLASSVKVKFSLVYINYFLS